ncbi:MAG: glycosyltransferase [Geobacter sp.]|nr:glycosyltransferase [Geobacter sp.]
MTTISIIIPVKRGGYVSAFDAIRQSGFDNDLYEVLLAEGCAPSRQRNMAAKAATGDLLYFIDDDSLLDSANLSICSYIMKDKQIAVVGGPSLTPDTDSWLQQLFGMALSSVFGAGGVRNRYRAVGVARQTTDKELILCNLVFRRSVFISVGGFNERLYPNEENELLDRVKSKGYGLMHVPEMCVFRSQRTTLKAFVRQMFSYGRGRASQSLITSSFSLISFIPLIFIVYLTCVLLFFHNVLLMLPLFMYTVLVMLFSLVEALKSGRISAILLIFVYPLMHIVNGYGLLFGLLAGKPVPVCSQEISVSKIKRFGEELPDF